MVPVTWSLGCTCQCDNANTEKKNTATVARAVQQIRHDRGEDPHFATNKMRNGLLAFGKIKVPTTTKTNARNRKHKTSNF